MNLYELLHRLIDKVSWFTEGERTEAHRAVTGADPEHVDPLTPVVEPSEMATPPAQVSTEPEVVAPSENPTPTSAAPANAPVEDLPSEPDAEEGASPDPVPDAPPAG